MPFIGKVHMKNVEAKYKLLKELQELCNSRDLLKNNTPDEVFVYQDMIDNQTQDGFAMIGVARYENTYVIQPASYLSGSQWSILEFFLRDMKPQDHIVVFSQELFNNVRKYSKGDSINLKFYG